MSAEQVEKGLVKGCEERINRLLKLPTGLTYRSKEACKQVSSGPVAGFDGAAFTREIYAKISDNAQYGLARCARTCKPPSEENWRWEPRPTLGKGDSGKGHTGAEVPLERAIAILSTLPGFGLKEDWTNQMPVGSGLTADPDGGRRIDLVHRSGNGTYYFIELKTSGPRGSDTPLHAAIEILIYGLAYIFSGVYRRELHYDREVLNDETKVVNLRVVAPTDFYKHSVRGETEKYDLSWFERALNVGLENLLTRDDVSLGSKLKMSFAFEDIPQNFISCLPGHDHGFVMKFEPKPVRWKEPMTR